MSSASLISTLPSASSESLRKQKYWTELEPGQTFSKPCSVSYPIVSENKTSVSKLSSPLRSQVCIQHPPVGPQQDTEGCVTATSPLSAKGITLL